MIALVTTALLAFGASSDGPGAIPYSVPYTVTSTSPRVLQTSEEEIFRMEQQAFAAARICGVKLKVCNVNVASLRGLQTQEAQAVVGDAAADAADKSANSTVSVPTWLLIVGAAVAVVGAGVAGIEIGKHL